MSVRWDALLAAASARELDEELRGSRVRSLLLDGKAHRLLLFMRECTLSLELHPLDGWLSLLPPHPPPSGALPYPFLVSGVHSPPDESMLVLGMRPARGQGEPEEIVVELIGNRRNAVVLGVRSRTIRHSLFARSGQSRSFTVGSIYTPPPPTRRWGIGPSPKEEWDALLSSPASQGEDRRGRLLRQVAWSSSLNAHLLLDSDGWAAWTRIQDPSRWGGFLHDAGQGSQPYPVSLAEGAEPAASLLDAFCAARSRAPAARPAAALLVPPALIDELERRLERAQSRLKSLRGQLERAQDPEIQRGLGDLILARFSEIRRGSAGLKLLDFEGREVEIRLDPSLTPNENASRFYQEAARSERARETLPPLIGKAERAVDKWAGALSRAAAGEPVDPLVSIPGPLGKKPPGEPSARAGRALPYKRFFSTGGLEIRVGRGARHNDALTFHHSAPTDIWLHVQQSAGAHVILRWPKRETPPRQDLAEAATLAALHSSDRHAGSVPVVWTRRRHVRKPRGSSAGSVVPERTKTVFVTPDRDLIERLTVNE